MPVPIMKSVNPSHTSAILKPYKLQTFESVKIIKKMGLRFYSHVVVERVNGVAVKHYFAFRVC